MNASIINRDCLHLMEEVGEESVDLIVTSPPYAMRRKETYGGVPVDEYVDWFIRRAYAFALVLKPTGSLVLNIKEHTEDGERHRYVYELVLAMRDRGWRLADEFIWHKPNPMPGVWNGRLKDGWEHLYHFTKAKDFKFFPDAVRQPIKTDSGNGHLLAQMQDGEKRTNKATRSGFGFSYDRHKKREAERAKEHGGVLTALPSNVLSVTNKLHKKDHPATFPDALPEFFIKLMTEPGDLVVDPFAGSGTTLQVARRLGRQAVGFEINADYCAAIEERLAGELV